MVQREEVQQVVQRRGSQVAGGGGAPGARLGGQVEVRVGAVQEGLAALAGLEDQPRPGLQGAAAPREPVLHIRATARRQTNIYMTQLN